MLEHPVSNNKEAVTANDLIFFMRATRVDFFDA